MVSVPAAGDALGEALVEAADAGDEKTLEEVLARMGATPNVNYRSARLFDISALHRAAAQGHVAIVRRLLEAGADPDVRNRWGWTPLHPTAQVCGVECAQALLEAGANPDVQDQNSDTPLTLAAQRGCTDIVRLLVKHGANKAIKGDKGRTAREWALENGFMDVAASLE